MTMRRVLSNIIISLCCVYLFGDHGDAAPNDAEVVLAEVRQGLPDSMSIEVDIVLPATMLPGQGVERRTMRVTSSRDFIAAVWTSQLPTPVYRPLADPGYREFDYDADGNLVVSMDFGGAVISSPTQHEEFSETITYFVSPAGTVVRQTPLGTLVMDRIGDSNTVSVNLLRRVLWALGRPMREDIGVGISVEANVATASQVRARGNWAKDSGDATANLIIDPMSAHLVRSASFGAEGEVPRAICKSEGIRRFGATTLAERGSFTVGPEVIQVTLRSFMAATDDDLVAEAKQAISKAKTSTIQLIDVRDDPHRPVIRMIQPGQLDR